TAEPGYFRHHYDAAVRAMLAARPPHVQGLIEAAWEATTGHVWTKPARPAPVLAVYVLDGRFHFFLDVPGGVSRAFSGGAAFELTRVERAARRGPVPLPAELADELVRLADRLDGWQTIEAPSAERPLALVGVAGGPAAVCPRRAYRSD